MGGAFGALGGDISAISINPASSSVFLDSEIGITLKYKNQKITNNFNNSKEETLKNLEKSKELSIEGINGFYIDSGAKHFVSEQKNIWPSNLELTEVCKICLGNCIIFKYHPPRPQILFSNFFSV